jgi:hypothetical protein
MSHDPRFIKEQLKAKVELKAKEEFVKYQHNRGKKLRNNLTEENFMEKFTESIGWFANNPNYVDVPEDHEEYARKLVSFSAKWIDPFQHYDIHARTEIGKRYFLHLYYRMMINEGIIPDDEKNEIPTDINLDFAISFGVNSIQVVPTFISPPQNLSVENTKKAVIVFSILRMKIEEKKKHRQQNIEFEKKSSFYRKCNAEDCPVQDLGLLSCACRKVSYCSKDCQTKDWKEHKKTCTARKAK